jgi:hypothetical protein
MFPNGKMKALTLSYDDGVEQDRRLVEILNRHGVKAAFNLNSGIQTGANGWVNKDIDGRDVHNVPVVYDIWAARIGVCAVNAGPAKCGGGLLWGWSAATGPGEWNPGTVEWRRSAYGPVMCSFVFSTIPIFFFLFKQSSIYFYKFF